MFQSTLSRLVYLKYLPCINSDQCTNNSSHYISEYIIYIFIPYQGHIVNVHLQTYVNVMVRITLGVIDICIHIGIRDQ